MIVHEPVSDVATIIRWAEGRLDPSTSAVVAEAATSDPQVHEIVAWLRGFHRAAAALPFDDVMSPTARSRPYGRHGDTRGTRSGPSSEIVARMLFDSRQDVPAADLISRNGDLIAYLAFTCDVADIVLEVRRSGPGRVRVEGRVLPADGVPRAFTVAASGPRMTAVHLPAVDAHGGFRLSELPDRVEKLRLSSGEQAVVVQFDVGWSRA